jgi:hypothetical protein
MSTSESPYSIPAAPQRIDVVSIYQESFFALIWPSVAFSILMLGLILFVELALPQAAERWRAAIDNTEWAILVTGLVPPLGSFFLTARRLLRSDGKRRSILRSLAIAVAVTIYWIGALRASIAMAEVVVGMVNRIHGIAISVITIAPLYPLLLCVAFKLCWREVRLRQFFCVSLGTALLFLLISFSCSSLAEFPERYRLTTSNTLFAIMAHCICFAWWFATPKLLPEKLQWSETLPRNQAELTRVDQ